MECNLQLSMLNGWLACGVRLFDVRYLYMCSDMSTIELIRQHVQALPAGELFTPAAFLGMGARACVDPAMP